MAGVVAGLVWLGAEPEFAPRARVPVGAVMPASAPPIAGLGGTPSTPREVVPSPKRIKVPGKRVTDADKINESDVRSEPVICTRSGPVSPKTRTGTLVTYSLRIT